MTVQHLQNYKMLAEMIYGLEDSTHTHIKNEDVETSPFPKLLLETSRQIVYNQNRSNHRIFAVSDGCHQRLNDITN